MQHSEPKLGSFICVQGQKQAYHTNIWHGYDTQRLPLHDIGFISSVQHCVPLETTLASKAYISATFKQVSWRALCCKLYEASSCARHPRYGYAHRSSPQTPSNRLARKFRQVYCPQSCWDSPFDTKCGTNYLVFAPNWPNPDGTTSHTKIANVYSVQVSFRRFYFAHTNRPESDYHLVNKHSRVINKNALFDTILPEPQESMREYAILAKRAEMTSEETIPKPSVEIRSEDDDIMEL